MKKEPKTYQLKIYFLSIFLSLLIITDGFSQIRGTTFAEMPDPTADTLSNWNRVRAGLNVSFATIDQRYAKSVAPKIIMKKTEHISGWKNERVSAQLLLWTRSEINNVRVSVSDFVSGQNRIASGNASARFIRYVMTDEFADGCGYRLPEDFAQSLSPDMLDDLESYNLEADKVRPVWITISIPKTAAAGRYKADVTINGDNIANQQLQINLEVLDRVLTDPAEWPMHIDYWQHPSAVARVDGVEMWSDAHFEALKPVMQMTADMGQKVITATLNKDPWNVQTYDPYDDMIIWTRYSDGSWTYDYEIFDRWVQFMMDLGVKSMINCYSIIPWNNEIHYRDARTGKLVNVVAKAGTPEFEKYWEPFLIDFVRHLRDKGWLEITNIAMDERTKEEVDGALALIARVAPELNVSYADNQKTYQRYPNSRDISISVQDPFSRDDLVDRKARGLNTTFYICCADGFPNQFTFSDPAESVYLGWYTFASGFDGVLHWSFNSWVKDPLHDSRFRTWPAGDTYIVYPQGRSSIRYERLIEGLQDYEKIRLIKEELPASRLAKLDKMIEKLNTPFRYPNWNKDLNAAKKELYKLSR